VYSIVDSGVTITRSMKWRVPDQVVTIEVLERGCAKDCKACILNREDAMDCSRWMKQIKDD